MTRVPRSSNASQVLLFTQQPALQLIYDTAPIGLACLSPDCRYLRINQRLTEICGISVDDHLGRTVRDCVPALADSIDTIVRSIMETGEPVIGVEVAGQRADQVEERYWATYWHPLRAPGGEIIAINVAAEEITERKRAEREVRAARDAAETALRHLRETQDSLIEAEKLAALGRMVAGIAHEVNSPVGISLTVATTLQNKAAQFALKAAGGDLRRSSLNAFLDVVENAATQLVANLRRSAERMQSFKQVALDQSQSTRRSFDASALAEEVLSYVTRDLKQEAVSLKFHGKGGLVMDSYPGPFGQALTHLVVNAMTHAFPDGLDGTVDIRVAASGPDHVELRVADNGCGMAPEIKRLAFDPFFTTRRHFGAAGLGLHIVHTIVTERLGGRVSLESEAGGGTTVSLILPREAPRPGENEP